jgi:ribosomal protein S27E
MAEAILIACPECDKKIHVPAEAVGKKIRCKSCEQVFVVPAPAGKQAAKPAAKTVPVKAPAGKSAKPPPKKPPIDDDGDGKPYGVTALDTAPRCPECANEMESAEAIICLTCGYNTVTRMKHQSRAVEHQTGGVWFWWLAPPITCAVFALIFLTSDILYTAKILSWVGGPDADYAFLASGGFIIWAVWAPTVPLIVALTTFAAKRLIFHPRPPEREKKKERQAED